MRRVNISNGDILYAFKDTIPVYAGKLNNQEYQAFTSDINGGINFLQQSSEASSNALNKYLGDATQNTKRNVRVQFKFGKRIGLYSGQSYEGDDDTYYKVQVSLTATYGGGSEVSMDGYGWVRESDITNDTKELETEVKTGNVTATKVDLAKALAEDAKAAVEDSTTKKDDTSKDNSSDLGKKAVIDGNQSLDASKTNWLLIGGIFAGVVALGGGLLYAFRTPKTP